MTRLRKYHVTTGVYLVEAPEVGLSILCGCPGDVIKHLMRRGLIVEAEANGIRYETGPNAILLSDVMLQNGMFCNLGEFPVLQMLYLQGMIVPGHPNNRGQRPLLIGLPEQVETQMKYIHRGNYGLNSREELLAAGASQVQADELMAMKLRFSFGHIRPPEELLDTVHLAGEPIVLRDIVEIRRLGLNLFQFRLGDETMAVDLNLPADQHYPAPYTLGRYSVDRDYFSVVHTGDGDGWDPNRPCMSSMVMFQGRVYLIDAGPSLHHNLTALGISVNELDGLFHTHCHDDHFAGMTALLHADRRIKYYATPLVRAAVTKKFAALMNASDDVFAHCFEPHDLELDVWNNIDGLEVKPFLSPHPVETNCYLFRAPWEGSYRSYAHYADLVSLKTLKGMRAVNGTPGISQGFYDKVVADYGTGADVKKIDIGGGMIHGMVDDFRTDTSGKIVLAHTARELTVAEKEIGSGAPFGSVDVIIPGDNHFAWRNAFEGLRTCFPDAPHHDIRMLLNSPLVVYNPQIDPDAPGPAGHPDVSGGDRHGRHVPRGLAGQRPAFRRRDHRRRGGDQRRTRQQDLPRRQLRSGPQDLERSLPPVRRTQRPHRRDPVDRRAARFPALDLGVRRGADPIQPQPRSADHEGTELRRRCAHRHRRPAGLRAVGADRGEGRRKGHRNSGAWRFLRRRGDRVRLHGAGNAARPGAA